MKKTFLLLCLFLVSVSTSFADDSYVSVKGGLFLPNSDMPGLKNFKKGYNFELAVGAKIHPNIAIEAAAGYYQTEIKDNFVDTYYDYYNDAYYTTTPTVSAIPVTLTIKGIIPLGKVDLFAGAGAGYYYTMLENKVKDLDGAVLGNLDETYNASAFGYHFVGGVDFNITDSVAIGAEIKQVYVKPESDISGYKQKVNMGGTIANAGVKFKFN